MSLSKIIILLIFLPDFLICQSSEKEIIDLTEHSAHWVYIYSSFYFTIYRRTRLEKRYLVLYIKMQSIEKQTQTYLNNHNSLKTKKTAFYLFYEQQDSVETVKNGLEKIFISENKDLGVCGLKSDEYEKQKKIISSMKPPVIKHTFILNVQYSNNDKESDRLLSPYQFKMGNKGSVRMVEDLTIDTYSDENDFRIKKEFEENAMINRLLREGRLGTAISYFNYGFKKNYFVKIDKINSKWAYLIGEENVEKVKALFGLTEGVNSKAKNTGDKSGNKNINKDTNTGWVKHVIIWGSLTVLIAGVCGLVYFLKRKKNEKEQGE